MLGTTKLSVCRWGLGGEVDSNAIDELRLIIGALTGSEMDGAWRQVRPIRAEKQNRGTVKATR